MKMAVTCENPECTENGTVRDVEVGQATELPPLVCPVCGRPKVRAD